jgi:hypothetical protein
LLACALRSQDESIKRVGRAYWFDEVRPIPIFQQITSKAVSSLKAFILTAQLGTQSAALNDVLSFADEKKGSDQEWLAASPSMGASFQLSQTAFALQTARW